MVEGTLAETPSSQPAPIEAYREAIRAGRPGAYWYVALAGLRPQDPIRIFKRIEKGLAFQALVRFQRNSGLSMAELAAAVAIKPRTLARRKKQGRLDPEESDRLLRLAAVKLYAGPPHSAAHRRRPRQCQCSRRARAGTVQRRLPGRLRRQAGLIRAAEPEGRMRVESRAIDPLLDDEWWLAPVRATSLSASLCSHRRRSREECSGPTRNRSRERRSASPAARAAASATACSR